MAGRKAQGGRQRKRTPYMQTLTNNAKIAQQRAQAMGQAYAQQPVQPANPNVQPPPPASPIQPPPSVQPGAGLPGGPLPTQQNVPPLKASAKARLRAKRPKINAQGGAGKQQPVALSVANPNIPVPVAAGKKTPGPGTKLAAAQAKAQQQAAQAGRLKRDEELKKLGIGQNLVQSVQALPITATSALAGAPQPFGIAFPLLVLLLLYLLLIPVNGKSRMQWLWLAIIKQAYVSGTPSASTPQIPIVPTLLPQVGGSGPAPYTQGSQNAQTYGGLVAQSPGGSYVYYGGNEY